MAAVNCGLIPDRPSEPERRKNGIIKASEQKIHKSKRSKINPKYTHPYDPKPSNILTLLYKNLPLELKLRTTLFKKNIFMFLFLCYILQRFKI